MAKRTWLVLLLWGAARALCVLGRVMVRRMYLVLLLAVMVLGLALNAQGIEKLKLASAIKLSANYYLPVLASEEKGFWKANGLEVEWVPFAGTGAMARALAAGAAQLGFIPTLGNVEAAGRGVPTVMVSELIGKINWYVWVRADSRIREGKDLKGSKIGVPQLGGTGHGFGLAMAKALGLEKDIRFIGIGGIREELAGLKAGAIDGIVEPLTITANLKVAGEVREVFNVSDLVPKEWFDHVVVATRDFTKKSPETIRNVIKSVVSASAFIRENRAWSLEKMKEMQGFSDKAAVLLYDDLKFTRTGRIDRKAVENVRAFLIEYGVISKEKTPPTDELFTNEYIS